jgi:hypothetical protein
MAYSAGYRIGSYECQEGGNDADDGELHDARLIA